MSDFSRFMKKNKKARGNVKYVATKSLTDEKGKPLEWTIKPLTSRENDEIRDSCTKEIPIKGNPNNVREKLDTSRYIEKLIEKSVVDPDLNDSQLQDSYGVMGAADLLYAMVDDPGEYAEFATFIQKFNGFTTSLNDKVEEAKN